MHPSRNCPFSNKTNLHLELPDVKEGKTQNDTLTLFYPPPHTPPLVDFTTTWSFIRPPQRSQILVLGGRFGYFLFFSARGIFFIFFLLGGGEREAEAPGGWGGGRFSLKIPKRGGVSRPGGGGGGRGAGRVFAGNLGRGG